MSATRQIRPGATAADVRLDPRTDRRDVPQPPRPTTSEGPPPERAAERRARRARAVVNLP